MADTEVFRGHHIIERRGVFPRSELLQALADPELRLFEIDGARNMLNLPVDRALATRLGVSPHPGGPLGGYTNGLLQELDRLQNTVDGQATLRGDRAAAQRIADRVTTLTDTMRAGLINGDLVTNTPEGMTAEQANARNRAFFGDLDGYRQRHAAQIADFGRMSAPEARWAGVTRSEGNVRATLDAIDQPGVKPVAGDALAGRQSLATGIADANQAGRLSLSETTITRVRTLSPNELPLTHTRPPIRPPQGVPAEGSILPEPEAPRGSTIGARAMRGTAVVAGGLFAVDLVTTGHRVVQLQSEGNTIAADSATFAFAARNVGGWGGFIAGAAVGARGGAVVGGLVTSETGPGAVIGAGVGGIVGGLGGGVVGTFVGDRIAEARDNAMIFTQTDRSGNEWTRNPEDPQGRWMMNIPVPTPTGGYRDTLVEAGGTLPNELNYRAANVSYSLGLGRHSTPQNPFSIPDESPPGQVATNWVRNPETGRWSRDLMDAGPISELQIVPPSTPQPATDEQNAALDARSQLIIAQNAANTPASIAARYQIAYNQFGWNQFASVEPFPSAVAHASTQTNTLRASNNSVYIRGADGEWSTSGIMGTSQATGNIREELNRTWQSQQVGLRQMSEEAAQALANPTPPEQNDLRSQVVRAYTRAGINDRTDAQIDAATTAVTQNHVRDGVGQDMPGYFLQLQSDGSLVTIVGTNDNRMEIRSTTTADDISQAQTRQTAPPQTQQPSAPAPSPETQQTTAPIPETPRPSSPPPLSEPRRPAPQEAHVPSPAMPTQASEAIIPGQPGASEVSRSVTSAHSPLPTANGAQFAQPHGPPPDDTAMHAQIRMCVSKIDEGIGKPWDARSEQVCASAYQMAVEAGFKPSDNVQVALSLPTATQPAGANLCVMRTGPGASPDPYANRAHMPMSEVMSAAPELSYQQANNTRSLQEQIRLQELAREPEAENPTRSGPVMS